MYNVKQVIVVRKDLKMPVGKVAAQVAHASLAVLLSRMPVSFQSKDEQHRVLAVQLNEEHDRAMFEWINGPFAKVVLAIDTEQELRDLYGFAINQGIPASMITDAGLTVFAGVPTLTCCAFGPCYTETLDQLTGHLKLLYK